MADGQWVIRSFGTQKGCPTCKTTKVFFGQVCPACNGEGWVPKSDMDLEREGQMNLLQEDKRGEKRR